MLVRPVSASDVIDLRHRVLRAGLPRDAAIFEGDGEPTTVHLAAFDTAGELVGCVTILHRPLDARAAWQLRGMAVAPELHRAGIGGRLLAHVDEIVAASDFSHALWCNARVPAVPFYARHGWTIASDVFEIPTAGPHRVMTKGIE
jgi:GNAT superfamily N-acetyltransferase